MKLSFVPQTFFRNVFRRIRITIPTWNSIKKVMLYILKISTNFGVISQIFCQNQNPVQDQDHDFILDFNQDYNLFINDTHKYCLLTPLKVIVSTPRIHVRMYRQIDRRTENVFCLFWVLSHTKQTFIKRRDFFFNHAITILFLFTRAVGLTQLARLG